MQLQLDGGLTTGATKHLPVPEVPSSQEEHPEGHGWQFGPKNPGEHDWQDVPVNPGAQLHVPDGVQTPDPAQGGEHVEDSISRSENEPRLLDGS
jgi:hypothetical protein